MTVRICPSILSADFANLEHAVTQIATADLAHIDVMDGHFVPNLTIGVPVVRALAAVAPLPLDVHLMIDDPDRWALDYVAAGAASVTFHVEAARAPIRLAREIRARGARAGIAVRPMTAIEPVLEHIAEFDLVLLMTVEPGFGGQSFIETCLAKIAATRRAVSAAHADAWIQVDGGVSAATIGRCAGAGADTFVAGSAVYGADDPVAEIARLRAAARTERLA